MASRPTLAQQDLAKYGFLGAGQRKLARDRAAAERLRATPEGLALTPTLQLRAANKKIAKATTRSERLAAEREQRKAIVRVNATATPEKVGNLMREAGKLSRVLNLGVSTSTEAPFRVGAALGIPGLGQVGRKLGQVAGGLAGDIAYVGPGVYHLATTDPRKSLPEIGKAIAAPYQHPIRTWQKRPQDFGYAALDIATLGASAAERAPIVAAARAAARDAGTSQARAAVGAVVRKPPRPGRMIFHDGQSTRAIGFDSPLNKLIGRATDRTLGLTREQAGKQRAFDLFAPARGKAAELKFRSEKMQNERVHRNLLQPEGPSPEQAARADMGKSGVRRALRIANLVTRDAFLYRPGRVPTNLLTQELLSLSEQGPAMLAKRLGAAKQRQTFTGRRIGASSLTAGQKSRLDAMSGTGRIISAIPEHLPGTGALAKVEKAVTKVDNRISQRLFGKLEDNPYRPAAYLHEVGKFGVKGDRAVGGTLNAATQHALSLEARKVVDAAKRLSAEATDPAKLARIQERAAGKLAGIQQQAREALGAGPVATDAQAARAGLANLVSSRRSNNAMIDYGRLGDKEKWIRDIAFLYPWVKGATQYSGRFPVEHPFQTTLLAALSESGRQHTGLPDELSSISRGSFKVGERTIPGLGRVPRIVNPTTVLPLGQPVDTLKDLIGNNEFHNPGEVTLPLYAELWKAHGHPYDAFMNTVKATAPYRFVDQGFLHAPDKNPQNRLYPRSADDAKWNFIAGALYPKPDNPAQEQSRVREEKTSGTLFGKPSAQERDQMKAGYVQSDLLDRVNVLRARNGTPALKELPAGISGGLDRWQALQQARRDAVDYPGAKLGRRLSVKGELIASVLAIGTSTNRDPAAVKASIDKIVAAPPEAQASLEAALKQVKKSSWFQSISQVRSTVNQVNEATHDLQLPYAEGGQKVSSP